MREPALRCDRAKHDNELVPQIKWVWHANMQVYGANKVWKQINREGIAIARWTIQLISRTAQQCYPMVQIVLRLWN